MRGISGWGETRSPSGQKTEVAALERLVGCTLDSRHRQAGREDPTVGVRATLTA
jgi:hypothetical protein